MDQRDLKFITESVRLNSELELNKMILRVDLNYRIETLVKNDEYG